ncbi:CB1 cannabinoid receptor-interacting protein 1-like [Saccostrea cucullata]|uniref:CB1 cannabinoid receptor-interacting protein 1-like n=1 Tax=Saccostrea cuccullata TaxID=36930 RepID=UPI002ED4928E
MASKFKVLLSLKRKEGGGGVFYKHDGERFTQPHTLKLNQNTDYVVTVQSNRKLRDLIIHGERCEVTEVKRDKSNTSDDSLKFSANFNTTGYAAEKKKGRKDIAVALTFDDGAALTVLLQCKFYSQSEIEHCRWGSSLTWIEYDCTLTEGQTGVQVNKHKFV